MEPEHRTQKADKSASVFRRAVFSVLAGFCLCALFFIPPANANPLYASIVMEADTGLILHQRHADKRLHPASLTKIMTLVMIFEALDQGHVRLSDPVRISSHAASMVPSKLGLAVGSTIRIEDVIRILVTRSANDIAVAVAEHLGGTEKRFAEKMTRRAREIGMNATTFRNASGLHHPSQISTARDMARLARHVQVAHAKYYHYFSTPNFTYQGVTYRNHNRLMETYSGMDGIKTGYIGASGYNLVASARRNNQRLIGVVFGGRSTASRNAHMATILDNGFARLNDIRVAQAKIPLPPPKPADISNPDSISGVLEIVARGDSSRAATGEGDRDFPVTPRAETQTLALATHAPQSPSPSPSKWSVQIGAFASRAVADRMIRESLDSLPRDLAYGSPVIVPLKTGDSLVYRARLTGYTRNEAMRLCLHFKDCVVIGHPSPASGTSARSVP